MTVYRADGTELTEALWPYSPATFCPLNPAIPNLTFERMGEHLVLHTSGDGVSIDAKTMRAIGAMMMQLASEIEADVANRPLTPHD